MRITLQKQNGKLRILTDRRQTLPQLRVLTLVRVGVTEDHHSVNNVAKVLHLVPRPLHIVVLDSIPHTLILDTTMQRVDTNEQHTTVRKGKVLLPSCLVPDIERCIPLLVVLHKVLLPEGPTVLPVVAVVVIVVTGKDEGGQRRLVQHVSKLTVQITTTLTTTVLHVAEMDRKLRRIRVEVGELDGKVGKLTLSIRRITHGVEAHGLAQGQQVTVTTTETTVLVGRTGRVGTDGIPEDLHGLGDVVGIYGVVLVLSTDIVRTTTEDWTGEVQHHQGEGRDDDEGGGVTTNDGRKKLHGESIRIGRYRPVWGTIAGAADAVGVDLLVDLSTRRIV